MQSKAWGWFGDSIIRSCRFTYVGDLGRKEDTGEGVGKWASVQVRATLGSVGGGFERDWRKEKGKAQALFSLWFTGSFGGGATHRFPAWVLHWDGEMDGGEEPEPRVNSTNAWQIGRPAGLVGRTRAATASRNMVVAGWMGCTKPTTAFWNVFPLATENNVCMQALCFAGPVHLVSVHCRSQSGHGSFNISHFIRKHRHNYVGALCLATVENAIKTWTSDTNIYPEYRI